MLKTDSLSAPVNESTAMRTDSCTQILHENLQREATGESLGLGKEKKKKSV